MFFSVSQKNHFFLVLDVGNGTVACALAESGVKPKILHNVRAPFDIFESPDPTRLVQDLPALIDEVLSKTIKDGLKKAKIKKIETVLVTVSSPWFALKTKNLELSKDKPFIISEEFINDVLKKEEEIFKKELLGSGGGNFTIIEKSIVHAKINGYTLDRMIGQRTKSLSSFLYLSVIEDRVKDILVSTILKHINMPRDKILIHTFPLVSFSTVRDIFPGNSNFVLMDVSADVTDLTLVIDDSISKSISFPSGRNFILRQIAKDLGSSMEVALSTLHLYNDEKINEDLRSKVDKVFFNVEKEWSIYFENAPMELSEKMLLPNLVYLTADNDVSGIYMQFLKLAKTDSTSNFRKNMNIVKVDSESLANYCDYAPFVKKDEFTEIGTIFCNKQLK